MLGRHGWTTEEDAQLRVVVLQLKVGNNIPWDRVSLKLNNGHNSGSCLKRYSELPSLQFQSASQIYFGGKKQGVAVSANSKVEFLQPSPVC